MAIPKHPNGRLSKLYDRKWKKRLAEGRPAIVKVDWMDACGGTNPKFNVSDSGWVDKTQFGIINTTVGYLMLCDEDWVVTAAELSEGNHPRDITEIPTAIVLEITIIQKADK